ncbi:PhaM family polyhydroxyalkanoate granule multifunctional regulatory protein [Xylophilus sp. ASV27]|uniref:PhaM family polyhydroxyalkanoate granule multifunctional regulatory protein n=1 Tax=Xylophilus sp. ASV27 TaxID=2795129 RepID=UPI0018EA413C
MSDSNAFGFGNFVPGFDFLQTLVQSAAKGAAPRPGAASGMPDWSSWIAPTLKAEDLEKRINELKTVQFWLEQNARALAATIQALEVQKMSLATLRSMNVQVGDLAAAFGVHAGAPATAPAPAPSAGAPSAAGPYDDMYTARPAAGPAPAPAQEAVSYTHLTLPTKRT